MRLDNAQGTLLGTCKVSHTGGWQTWQTFTCAVDCSSANSHPLYLVFKGPPGRLFDVKSFSFVR